MKQYLAIDIGGTSVKLGLVDETGGILAKAEESVSFDGWQTPILTTVLAAAERFLTARGEDPQALEGIGVSATGQINSHTGVVAGTCGNLPNYIGSPIKEQLEAKFHRPVTVANDANCMCLGEVWVGGAKGYTDVIGVTLGTGVGGGILTGGRLLEGARGLGGEMGHYRTHAQHDAAHQLDPVGTHAQHAVRSLPHSGECLRQQIVQRFPVCKTLAELRRLGLELGVGERLVLVCQRLDLVHNGVDGLELPGAVIAKQFFHQTHNIVKHPFRFRLFPEKGKKNSQKSKCSIPQVPVNCKEKRGEPKKIHNCGADFSQKRPARRAFSLK